MGTCTIGTVAGNTVVSHTRTAKGGEADHGGYVATLILTPVSGEPVELLSRPNDLVGLDAVTRAGHAVVKALHVVKEG